MSSRQQLESPGAVELGSNEDLVRPQASESYTTIPETPKYGPPRALAAIQAESASVHLTRSVRRGPKTPQVPSPIAGTPLAVGAIRGRKSFSYLSHITSVSSPLQTSTISGLSASSKRPARSVLTSREKNDVEISDIELERMESELLLEVMRCQRNICLLENDLAKARLDENVAMCKLYQLRAGDAERRLEGAEFDLGCVRNTIRKNEASRQLNPKRRCISSPRGEPASDMEISTFTTIYFSARVPARKLGAVTTGAAVTGCDQ
ncbi:hypothetical protein BV22DRAFT_1051477 [Leucogyrophana mollusca]|uniref:Uncharacterized protein n=1 Tax=Leucogyrophana mollusca TaxID=85980 RepID=A0ACB8B0W4_9AGAM|nr:hypothetical protein BV22DRAFT_1051477 [Leucogyrophana mollusca]